MFCLGLVFCALCTRMPPMDIADAVAAATDGDAGEMETWPYLSGMPSSKRRVLTKNTSFVGSDSSSNKDDDALMQGSAAPAAAATPPQEADVAAGTVETFAASRPSFRSLQRTEEDKNDVDENLSACDHAGYELVSSVVADIGLDGIQNMSPKEYLEFVASIDIEEEQDANAKLIEVFKATAGDNDTKNKERERNMAWLEVVAKTGAHQSQDRVYQDFMREKKINKELAKRYDAASKGTKPNELKKAIRSEYAMVKYAKKLKEKEHLRSYASIDETLGKYMNYGQLVA